MEVELLWRSNCDVVNPRTQNFEFLYAIPTPGRAPPVRQHMNKFRGSAPMGQQQPAYHITCTQSQAITNTYTLVQSTLGGSAPVLCSRPGIYTCRRDTGEGWYGRYGACGFMIASFSIGGSAKHKYLMQRELELAKLRNSQGSDRHLDGVVVVRSMGTVLHLVLSHFLIVSTDVG